jgi:condensin complex subunit 2
MIYTQATSNSAIIMPKKDWKSKSRHLLPDDKHFNSKSLLSLFLKPKARIGRRRTVFGSRGEFGNAHQDNAPEGDLDEAFWARQKAPLENNEDTVMPQGDYDANFFQDDDGLPFAGVDDEDDLEFADAREHFSPDLGGDPGLTEGAGITALLAGETTSAMNGAFGTTLVTQTRRVRPEYVQYARVAKKVDVRRLKEEIWKGMGLGQLEVSFAPLFLRIS